jgi:hypothetical protein
MEGAGAIATSVASESTRLAPNFATEHGKRMFEIVQGMRSD